MEEERTVKSSAADDDRNQLLRHPSESLIQTMIRHRNRLPSVRSSNRWKVLLYGQMIALTSALVNASSFALTYNFDISLPFSLMFVMYVLLSAFLFRLKRQKDLQENVSFYNVPCTNRSSIIPWWIYLCMSVMDVAANWLNLLSFRYTSLTSTTLLGSLTVPSTMVASRILLSRTFHLPHYAGVCLCIVGATMTVWLDVDNSSLSTSSGDNDGPEHSFLGDCLAVLSAALYGFGDTIAEYSTKHLDRYEYLGFIGLFGAIQTGVQAWFWERDDISEILSDMSPVRLLEAGAIFVFYILVLFCYYVSSTIFLINGDATLMNLSLQSAPFWAILFVIAAEGQQPAPAFYVALLFVVGGVFTYELVGGTTTTASAGDAKSAEEQRLLNGDSKNSGNSYV